jgi:hypothetical protein
MSSNPLPPEMLQYASAPQEALAPTAQNAHLLQQNADHRSATRLLRNSGGWSIFWGTLCLLIALGIFRFGFFSMSVLAIGCGLLGVGLWLVVAPSPLGMLIDGIMLIGLSLLNLVTYVGRGHRPFATYDVGLYLPLFVITFVAGVFRIVRYRRFARVKFAAPTPPTRKFLDEVYREMRLLTPAREEAMIKIEGNEFPPVVLKAQLADELAICLINTRLLFVPKNDFTITMVRAGKKKHKVKVAMPEKTIKGLLPLPLWDRYRAWKGEDESAEEAVVLEEE